MNIFLVIYSIIEKYYDFNNNDLVTYYISIGKSEDVIKDLVMSEIIKKLNICNKELKYVQDLAGNSNYQVSNRIFPNNVVKRVKIPSKKNQLF